MNDATGYLNKTADTLWHLRTTILELSDNCAAVGLKKMNRVLNEAAEKIEHAVYVIQGPSESQKSSINKADFRDSFTRMADMAEEQNLIVYNIHFCRAGVGVQWFDEKKCPDWEGPRPVDYKQGLVTYSYYGDLDAMVEGEITRLVSLKKGE